MVGCDHLAISKLLTDVNASKQKVIDDAQIYLTGSSDPTVVATSDSMHVMYPLCKEKYPTVSSLFTTDLTVSDEMEQEGNVLEEAFQQQITVVKKFQSDNNAIDKELN